MDKLIDLNTYPVSKNLKALLKDKTTKKNIIFATSVYSSKGTPIKETEQMTEEILKGFTQYEIQPRVLKNKEQQQERTRAKAEVFTPSWICNKMNNHCDEEWFGRKDVFNVECEQGWLVNTEKVEFDTADGWKKYVDSKRLEITCGEAPYIVSRYDAATGELLEIRQRIGILDRKLRVVNENTDSATEWFKWVLRAYQSVYGYEFQGDSLLIARINLLITFVDYMQDRWGRVPTDVELRKIVNVIVWNLWQMDGLHLSVPGGKPQPEAEQLDLFSMFGAAEPQPPTVSCKVKNWHKGSHGTTQNFETIQEGSTSMKFDYVIGNPPYQDERQGTSTTALPVYNNFIDASYKVGSSVMLITPARFLFNAGRTPKQWNEQMLNDEHLKVLYYEKDGEKVFPNTDIKGGVAITYRDEKRSYGAIGTFTIFPELNLILRKVKNKIVKGNSLADIMFVASKFNTNTLFNDFPIYAGHERRMSSNVLTFDCFHEVEEGNDISVYGIVKGKRQHRYISARYVDLTDTNIERYKLILPKADGNGTFGDILTNPEILPKRSGFTHTFLGIGSFMTEAEAKAEMKYVKTKFARALLGVLKVTQDNNADKWKYVPLQDFTAHSDIDWSKSVAEIDQQLYRKYDLTEDEIEFIETHVKEMA